MPSWARVLQEINNTHLPSGAPDLDGVRRAKLRAVADHTHRPLLVYAVDFYNQPKIAACNARRDAEAPHSHQASKGDVIVAARRMPTNGGF